MKPGQHPSFGILRDPDSIIVSLSAEADTLELLAQMKPDSISWPDVSAVAACFNEAGKQMHIGLSGRHGNDTFLHTESISSMERAAQAMRVLLAMPACPTEIKEKVGWYVHAACVRMTAMREEHRKKLELNATLADLDVEMRYALRDLFEEE